MEEIKCPVCGKPGIPDYHEEDVVCPQCKSDLSIYRVIDHISDSSSETDARKWKILSAVALVAAAVCGILLLINAQQPNNPAQDLSRLNQLTDSVTMLKMDLQKLQNSQPPSTSFYYVIRRGDSYWLISKKLYGTGIKAGEIASSNNKTLQTPLYVGDTLKIK